MKVLLFGINFAPEPTGIGRYSGDMAAWLAEHGVEVRAICAPPYYPDWKIAPGQAWPPYRVEQWKGVQVHRVPLWVPHQPRAVARLLHLSSYAIASIPVAIQQIFWRPDVVLAVAPALSSAPVALAVARVSGARAWLHVQDFEVDVAFGMGMLKGGRLKNAVLGVERWLLRAFDRVTSISGQMIKRLHEKGVPADRVGALNNWADLSAIKPLSAPSPYRAELGIADGAVVVQFSGTLSGKQGLRVLPAAARLLADRSDIQFVICGDGPMRAELEAACAGLGNVRMLPTQPYERLNDLLGMADIHVLPQSPEAADLVLPSKLSGMLASGRPVIATCAAGTEIESVVKHCGRVVPPEDAERLADAIRELAADRPQRERLGAVARQYAEAHVDRETVLNGLLHELSGLAGIPVPSMP